MRSLYRRLTITHTVVALLTVLLVGVLASGLIVRAYRQVANEQTVRQARLVAERLRAPLGQLYIDNQGWGGVAKQLDQRLAENNIDAGRVVVANAGGRVLFDSTHELVGRQMPPRIRLLSVSILARGRTVGAVAVLPNSDRAVDAERTFVRSIIWIVGVGSLVATSFALLIALFVARRLVRPLHALTLAARRLAAGERHEPLALPADTELANLAQAFNGMAAELDRQERLRRNMVADIAHELRTPLSVLRLQVESMEDGIVAPSPASVGALGDEIDLLARLVDDLRLISLADAGQLSLLIQAVDPRQAVEQAVRAAAPRARQDGINLRVVPGPALPAICADPQRLAQVLGNLVENAIRYTPAGGSVTLAAEMADGGKHGPVGQQLVSDSHPLAVVLSIADSGPGIPPGELPHIFERFYRTDRARARETGGSGLGLAIVQRLVQAQGGSIRVQSLPGKGTTFYVVLPIS